MADLITKLERNMATIHEINRSLYTKERSVRSQPMPIPASLPRLAMAEVVRGWVALVLAVSHVTRLTHNDILRHVGRSSKRLADARRLLCWAFMEVTELDSDLGMRWLEQCVALGHRSVADNLGQGGPPPELGEALQIYQRLVRAMGAEDVKIAAAAGILGAPRQRSTLWPKGFLKRLGLEAHSG